MATIGRGTCPKCNAVDIPLYATKDGNICFDCCPEQGAEGGLRAVWDLFTTPHVEEKKEEHRPEVKESGFLTRIDKK